jgi:hypothetical protein
MAAEDVTEDETVDDEENQQEEEVLEAGTIEDQGNAGPPPPATQQPAVPPAFAKQLTDADYYGRQRARLEREYEQEMATVLEGVRRKVLARVRAEANGS